MRRARDWSAQSAAQSWTNVSGSSLVINATQTFSGADTARWGGFNNDSQLHEIFFVRSNAEWYQITGAGAGGTLGVTVSPYSAWSCTSREFYDTDILINGFLKGQVNCLRMAWKKLAGVVIFVTIILSSAANCKNRSGLALECSGPWPS